MAIGNTSKTALSATYTTLRASLLALDLSSTICLSILLVTVTLSERVTRHPVFINFLITLLLFSCLRAYAGLGELSFFASKQVIKNQLQPDPIGQSYGVQLADLTFDLFQTPLQDMVWMTTQIASLNLLIHTWFTLRSMLKTDSKELVKRRTFLLVITPYVAGLLPIIELLPSAANKAQTIISLSQVAVHLVTAVWALFLIFSFMRQQRVLKKVKVQMSSVTTLIKLLVFSLYGVGLTILLLAAGATNSYTLIAISLISQSFFAMCAFILFGFDPKILEIWFPRLFKVKGGAYLEMDSSYSESNRGSFVSTNEMI